MLPATTVRHTKINDFIYLSEGNSNSFLIVTPEGRIVVNTGMGFEAPVHKEYFDSIDSSPVRYVIFTQGHVDHVGGADHFVEAGTEIIAQANNQEHQSYDNRLQPFRGKRSMFAFAKTIAAGFAYVEKLQKAGTPISGQAQPKPTITFDDHYAFELGGIELELIAISGAETEDSLVIWLPQHKICLTGNAFGALFGHFPNLVTIRGDRYRDALRYVATLDKLLALDAEMLLVGHHEPVVGRDLIRSELERMRNAVLYVHDRVVMAMNAGDDVWSAMRDIQLPPDLEVGEGYGKLPWSIRAIWEQYSGWFHARSTTELYPVPPWSVAADVVALAGGPDGFAEAAQKKVAAGAPVEALHLVELALDAEPAHRPSIEASLAAHRALLEESVNFWETRWLEREIETLERRLENES